MTVPIAPDRTAPPVAPPVTRQGQKLSLARFAQYVLVALAILALAGLAWRLADVFILVFGAIIVALVLRALSDPVARLTGLPERLALAIVVVALLSLFALGGLLIGERLAAELDRLVAAVPEAWTRLRAWLEQHRLGRSVLDAIGTLSLGSSGLTTRVAGLATFTFSALVDAVLVIVLGIFLAGDPDLYQRGLVRLVPNGARAKARKALAATGYALRRWLLGQGLQMLTIGLLTGLGLWALGIPMALGLGILAGLLEFIPYFGPFLAAAPGILLAFAVGPVEALYALGLYVAVQQIEGNVITPLAQRWAVSLAPALALLSVIIFGLLFGVPGVLFATPLMVAVVALVNTLYVDTSLVGHTRSPAPAHAG